MLLVGSIAFWSVVGYLAFRPQTTRLPAMGPVEVHRRRRMAPSVPSSASPAAVPSSRLALTDARPDAQALPSAPPSRAALPWGGIPMPGAIGAVPLPPAAD